MHTDNKQVVQPAVVNDARGGTFSVWVLVAALLHVPLAFMMRGDNTISTLHAVVTFGIGLLYVVSGRDIARVVYVAAYIAGAEVLWRMTKANVPWEFVKYAIVALLGLLLLRSARSVRFFALPMAYILLLCLSIPLTIEGLGFGQKTLSELSFNLSGPLCLTVAALFFRQSVATEYEYRVILSLVAMPVIGVATLALSSILTTDIYFGLGSNVAASGGYGPNQVSSVLGLAALCSFLIAIMDRDKNIKAVALIFMFWFLSQAVLTLSRGGLFGSILCMILVGLHLLRDPRKRTTYVSIAAIVLFVGGFFIVPQLDAYTYGAVDKRLQDVNTTHRMDIVLQDLEVWRGNPLIGAGPGMSAGLRAKLDWTGMKYAAHTEFSRLLSEHGIAGLTAMLILIAMGWKAYRRSANIQHQALVAGFLAWSLSEMTHSAMRLGAVPFMFAFALLQMRIGVDATLPPTRSSSGQRIEPMFRVPLKKAMLKKDTRA